MNGKEQKRLNMIDKEYKKAKADYLRRLKKGIQ